MFCTSKKQKYLCKNRLENGSRIGLVWMSVQEVRFCLVCRCVCFSDVADVLWIVLKVY